MRSILLGVLRKHTFEFTCRWFLVELPIIYFRPLDEYYNITTEQVEDDPLPDTSGHIELHDTANSIPWLFNFGGESRKVTFYTGSRVSTLEMLAKPELYENKGYITPIDPRIGQYRNQTYSSKQANYA
jgi:hypothetical protein